MKCLLVDDEPGIREGLAALLRRKGHDVRTAGDCAAARAALAAERFDVVVTDWRLPDGVAAEFAVDCDLPVFAVSGHPEEVSGVPGIRAVLTKPCSPARLLEAIGALAVTASAPAAAPAAPAPLPRDVAAVLEAFTCQVPAGLPIEQHDDGVLLSVRVALPLAAARALAVPGGDLRCRRDGEHVHVELRLCRDGRPGLHLPSVAPTAPWPARTEFAVDFHGSDVTAERFAELLAARASARAAGRTVHFLNVPTHLASHGTPHDMPMSGPVGPRLLPEHTDLWSQP
jgi:CheY-like chemotaxis protein